jgi:DNA-binding transcriptional LysR family regulator
MLNMDINDARTFVVVAEAGSISRAARELHLTQPAVTRRIQRLEQAVGASLIDRSKRPFALTDTGQLAVERCRRMVALRDELKSLSQEGGALARECRIGIAHALTELALQEPVDEMRRAFPAIALRLFTGWSREIVERVRSGALDAGVVLLPDRESLPAGVEGTALATEALCVIGARAWKNKAWSLKDTAEAGWILNPEGCAARAGLQRAMSRAGYSLRVGVETYNYDLQMSLVARGRGLGLVPERLLGRSPHRRDLSTLNVRGLQFPMVVWLVTGESSAPLEPALTTLAQGLTERLGGNQASTRSSRPRARGP